MKSLPMLLLVLLCGCNKCDDEETPKLDFSCVKLYNDQGEDNGIHGCTSSDDWTFNTLSPAEEAYFLSNDTVSLSGTTAIQVSSVSLSPIPVVQGSFFSFHLLGPSSGVSTVKLQLAIIDESKNILLQHTLKLSNNQGVQIQVPADKFDRGEFYRVYYRVSALGQPIVFEGYGNIVVCKQAPVFNIDTDCI